MSTESNQGGDGKAPEPLTPDQVAELQRKAADLEAKLSRKDDEHAKELAALQEQIAAGGKAPKVEVAGRVKLTTMPSGGGKKSTKEYKLAPGFPKVRLANFEIVQLSVFMQLAQGDKLSDEQLEANPTLKDWTSKQAIAFLEKQAAKGVAWLLPV